MIIGIDASQANRQIRSGTEWYAFYLIEEFKKLLQGREDVEVRLYVRDSARDDIKNSLPANFSIRELSWPFPYFWVQGRLSLELATNPVHIMFSPAHTIPMIHPRKMFTALHDIGFEDNPELYDRKSLWYHRFSAKAAVKRAYHIFTISNFSKERIMKVYNCPAEKICVHYLGYDKEKFKLMPQEQVEPVLQKYNLKYKNYIFYIGRLEPKKNIYNMVSAYEQVWRKDNQVPRLVLAGREIDIQKVKKYLTEKPELKNQIKFLGYVDEVDTPALYNGAKLFFFPTLYEGFGLPIIEAQACGTPVITSNTTSNPEAAGDAALIVDPRNIDDLAKSLKDLLTDSSLAKTLIKRGFENVKQFSWQQTAGQILTKILSS